MAFVLLQNGFKRVNPFIGGLAAWMDAGFPMEP
jgi:rhodanese-related sulfurtransferase